MVTCCRFAFFVSYREDDPSVWISTMHFNSRGKLKITIHFRNGPHRRILLCWLLTDLMGVQPLLKRRRWNSYSPGHMNDCCIVLIAVALYTCGEERRSVHNYTLRIKRQVLSIPGSLVQTGARNRRHLSRQFWPWRTR